MKKGIWSNVEFKQIKLRKKKGKKEYKKSCVSQRLEAVKKKDRNKGNKYKMEASRDAKHNKIS